MMRMKQTIKQIYKLLYRFKIAYISQVNKVDMIKQKNNARLD